MKQCKILLCVILFYGCKNSDKNDYSILKDGTSNLVNYDHKLFSLTMDDFNALNEDVGISTSIGYALYHGRESFLIERWDDESDPVKRKMYVFAILFISSTIENHVKDDFLPLCRIYQRSDGMKREEEILDVIKNRSIYAYYFIPLIVKMKNSLSDDAIMNIIAVEEGRELNPGTFLGSRQEVLSTPMTRGEYLSYMLKYCERLANSRNSRFWWDTSNDELHYGLYPDEYRK